MRRWCRDEFEWDAVSEFHQKKKRKEKKKNVYQKNTVSVFTVNVNEEHFNCKNALAQLSVTSSTAGGWQSEKFDNVRLSLTTCINRKMSEPLFYSCWVFFFVHPQFFNHYSHFIAPFAIQFFLSVYLSPDHAHRSSVEGLSQSSPFTPYQMGPILPPDHPSLSSSLYQQSFC